MNSGNFRNASNYLETAKNRWSSAIKSKTFRIQSLITIGILIPVAVFIPFFFNFIQSRPGYLFTDLLMNIAGPIDLSLYTFILIYSAIISGIAVLGLFPYRLLKSFQAYTLLVFLRILSLFLIPLEPATDLIPLNDPFIGYFFYGNTLITKDLFFSGHVSTLLILVLGVPFKILKLILIIITFLTAVFLLVQHVHYSIDLLAAPVFSWISYRMASLIPLEKLS